MLMLGVVLLCTACRKDKEIITEEVFYGNDPEVVINASISGVVLNEEGQPIADATIDAAGRSLLTDDNGFFYFKDILANQDGENVIVAKEGYYETSELVYPKLNTVSFIEVRLLESDESGLVSAGTGGVVTINGGATLTLPANAVVHNGVNYTGNVHVHARWLNPEREDLHEIMPGNLIGVEEDGSIVGMTTFGMIGAELYGDGGELLEIASGMTAELFFPVSQKSRTEAPGEIALWTYATELGYWMEEGVASLKSDGYVAQVSHFSFWNCDAPFDLINLTGKVINQNGDPVAQTPVWLERQSVNRSTGYGRTGMDGYFSGKVPKNEKLTLTVRTPCGDIIHEEEVGPFSSDHLLGEITVTQDNHLRMTGQLLDCDLDPVINGYVLISSETTTAYGIPDASGDFDVAVFACDQKDLTVIGKDFENRAQGSELIFSWASNIDAGSIVACGQALPYIRFEVDGSVATVEPCKTYIAQDTSGMSNDHNVVWGESSEGLISITFEGTSPGDYSIMSVQWGIGNIRGAAYNDINATVTIDAYNAAQGGYVSGTFSGTAKNDQTGENVEVSGEFLAIRE